MKQAYSAEELNRIRVSVSRRVGWDFSSMRTIRGSVPWDYASVVKRHVSPTAAVLDVGTGGGERLLELSPYFGHGLGVDIDPGMVRVARGNADSAGSDNLSFCVEDGSLHGISERFDVILNRQAPYDLAAVAGHLRTGGWFITQQVGEHNMDNVAKALGREGLAPTITREVVTRACLDLVDSRSTTLSTWSKTSSHSCSGSTLWTCSMPTSRAATSSALQRT